MEFHPEQWITNGKKYVHIDDVVGPWRSSSYELDGTMLGVFSIRIEDARISMKESGGRFCEWPEVGPRGEK